MTKKIHNQSFKYLYCLCFRSLTKKSGKQSCIKKLLVWYDLVKYRLKNSDKKLN